MITVFPETKVVEAVKIMFKSRVSGLPITNKKGRLIGIVSEKDALGRSILSIKSTMRVLKALLTLKKWSVKVLRE